MDGQGFKSHARILQADRVGFEYSPHARRMVKVELHAHTSEDPGDRIPHSTEALLERASLHGYGALAITLHNRWFDPSPWAARAAGLGLTLLSGIEKGIDGRHVLAINVPHEIEQARSFDDLRAVKRRAPESLFIAPHPFFPIPSALGPLMDGLVDLLDAVEINAMYTASLDYNRAAREWAAARRVPLVGNCDLHRLDQLGSTWTEVDAGPDADAICRAIKAGRVTVQTAPLSWPRAVWTMLRMEIGGWGRAHLR
jgi:predicted metal-dependent phosphoesterase TrpH